MKRYWLLLLGVLIPLIIGANYTVFTDLKATGEFAVEGAVNLDGALVRIGAGSYTIATGDGDLGVADAFEVNGQTRLDGAVDINAAVAIDGGLTNIGTGTFSLANGDNDLGVDGDFEVNGNSQHDGTLTVASTLTATGNIVANGNVTGDGATVLSGMILSVSTTQGSRSLVATDSQKVVVNASSASTLTLPTSVAGLVYTVLIRTSTTTYIDCAGTDRIFGTNADGDRISSATEGETITLLGVGTSGTHNWYPLTKTGTWADAN